MYVISFRIYSNDVYGMLEADSLKELVNTTALYLYELDIDELQDVAYIVYDNAAGDEVESTQSEIDAFITEVNEWIDAQDGSSTYNEDVRREYYGGAL
jgi:hypothetical protein